MAKLTESTVQRAFFFALLFAVTLAFIWLIRGFLQPIFWAVALGIVVYPGHRAILRRLSGRPSLAAVLSVLLVVVVVILPLIGIAAAVTGEAAGLYQRVSAGNLGLDRLYQSAQNHLPQVVSLLDRLGVEPERITSQISSAAVTVSQFLASRALALGQDTVRITVFFFLMLYLLFFFLRDGPRLLESLVRALPLGDERERHLLDRFAEVSRATIKGTLVVGLVQGTIGGIAFAVLGIGAPVLWGVVMALLSILPAAGPAFVWLPAAIILIANQQIVAGIVLILIGVFVIGLVDNVLRPILVGRDTRLPDYLILLSTLGGLGAFGLAGIVIGPIIAAFFLSVWEMSEEEFGPALERAIRQAQDKADPTLRNAGDEYANFNPSLQSQRTTAMADTETRNEQLLREFFDTLSTGDLEALRPLLHVDGSWEATAQSIPGSGITKGRDKVIDEFLAPVRGLFEPGDPKVIIKRIFSKGPWVAAETEAVGKLSNGKDYHNHYAWIVEIRDDKIYALREYMDSGYILKQLDLI